jgi:hypothetical protein
MERLKLYLFISHSLSSSPGRHNDVATLHVWVSHGFLCRSYNSCRARRAGVFGSSVLYVQEMLGILSLFMSLLVRLQKNK